jgi:hypothetical protein
MNPLVQAQVIEGTVVHTWATADDITRSVITVGDLLVSPTWGVMQVVTKNAQAIRCIPMRGVTLWVPHPSYEPGARPGIRYDWEKLATLVPFALVRLPEGVEFPHQDHYYRAAHNVIVVRGYGAHTWSMIENGRLVPCALPVGAVLAPALGKEITRPQGARLLGTLGEHHPIEPPVVGPELAAPPVTFTFVPDAPLPPTGTQREAQRRQELQERMARIRQRRQAAEAEEQRVNEQARQMIREHGTAPLPLTTAGQEALARERRHRVVTQEELNQLFNEELTDYSQEWVEEDEPSPRDD